MSDVERHESDPCGWNILGLLLERQGLFKSAKMALHRGMEEATLSGVESLKLDALRCNLGRIHISLQDYQQSVDILKQVTIPSFVSQTELGLALFKGLLDACNSPVVLIIIFWFLFYFYSCPQLFQPRNMRKRMKFSILPKNGLLQMMSQKHIFLWLWLLCFMDSIS